MLTGFLMSGIAKNTYANIGFFKSPNEKCIFFFPQQELNNPCRDDFGQL